MEIEEILVPTFGQQTYQGAKGARGTGETQRGGPSAPMGETAQEMKMTDIPCKKGNGSCSADHTTELPPFMAMDIPTMAPTAAPDQPRLRCFICIWSNRLCRDNVDGLWMASKRWVAARDKRWVAARGVHFLNTFS